MEILTYKDVEDWQMTEPCLACFGHPYSREYIEKRIETDCRIPDWGGDLFAKEGDEVLGFVGLLFPRAKTKEGIQRIGGIRNVCTRPSQARRGVAKKLFERAHKIMGEEGVRFSILCTSASLVAHNLYLKLGYRDIYTPHFAYKKTRDASSKICFRKEEDPGYVRSVYEKNVEGLHGLVIREEDFWESAEARGFPKNGHIRIAYEDNDRVGYASYNEEERYLTCNELGVETPTDLPKLLSGLEEETEREYVLLNNVNPNHKKILEGSGFRYSTDGWERIMVKDFDGRPEKTFELFGREESFHVGVYEDY